jgi:hypothetical protein
VKALFRGLWSNDDARAYRIGRHMLDGRYRFLEEDGIGLGIDADAMRPRTTAPHQQEEAERTPVGSGATAA